MKVFKKLIKSYMVPSKKEINLKNIYLPIIKKLNCHRKCLKCMPECSTQSFKCGNHKVVAVQIGIKRNGIPSVS